MEIRHLSKPVRSSAVLTNSYVAGTVLGGEGKTPGAEPLEYTQLLLYVNFTIGSLTTAEIKVEFSEDGVNYYQETFASTSNGVKTETLGYHQLSASGSYRLVVPINDRYIKVSSKGTGIVTNSLLSISAILATN